MVLPAPPLFTEGFTESSDAIGTKGEAMTAERKKLVRITSPPGNARYPWLNNPTPSSTRMASTK
jgi:hypothetical protein